MAQRTATTSAWVKLDGINGASGTLNVIIDTPQGSRNKFKFDETLNLFRLRGVLPVGASFPFDFGFIPSTRGGDGDPLDALVLLDEPAFVGCLVEVRLIGVIEATQTVAGKTERNDRLIAVAVESRTHHDVKSLEDLNANLVDEIEHFFVSYNEVKGKIFTPQRRAGPRRARNIVEAATEKRNMARAARPARKGAL